MQMTVPSEAVDYSRSARARLWKERVMSLLAFNHSWSRAAISDLRYVKVLFKTWNETKKWYLNFEAAGSM